MVDDRPKFSDCKEYMHIRLCETDVAARDADIRFRTSEGYRPRLLWLPPANSGICPLILGSPPHLAFIGRFRDARRAQSMGCEGDGSVSVVSAVGPSDYDGSSTMSARVCDAVCRRFFARRACRQVDNGCRPRYTSACSRPCRCSRR